MDGGGWASGGSELLLQCHPQRREVLRVPATILLYAVRARAATRVARATWQQTGRAPWTTPTQGDGCLAPASPLLDVQRALAAQRGHCILRKKYVLIFKHRFH